MLIALAAWLNAATNHAPNFNDLAEAFLKGQLNFTPTVTGDTTAFNGKFYLPHAPLPVVLMMPLVAIGQPHVGAVFFLITLSTFYLCYRLARRFGYPPDQSCWFAIAYCFGTSYVAVGAIAWGGFFNSALVSLFLFLAINEYEGGRRYWLIGAWIGLAMTSRQPAALNALFFVLAILSRMASRKGKVAQLAKFGIGLGVFVVLIALYNYARFGNPLESGYSMQMIRGIAYTALDVPGNRPGSLFSLGSMPGNLSVFFFGLPEVRAVGTSVFIVSPYLIYLWRVKWDLTSKLIAVDIAVVLLALMAFRSTGFEQMGYRFSLDFLPFVFWLLIRSRVPMTATFKTLIVGATIVDAFLVGYFLATGTERQILF